MPSSTLRRLLGGITVISAALLGACGGGSDSPTGPGPGPGPEPLPDPTPVIQGRAIFGLTCSNSLVQFGSGNPGTLARNVTITGMTAGALMVGIDFRPADGRLYGVGTDSRVYTIDTTTGAATAVGGAFSPSVNGEHFGLAFSGAQDRLRLSSVEGNQNLGLDPLTGAVASAEPDLAFAASDPNAGGNPAISALAYREAGGSSSLYAVDATANALVAVDPATGGLTTVGGFGFNVYLCSGLDIDADGTGYASLSTDNGSELYTIDLATGGATLLGNIGPAVHSLALAP
jgi:outer membrane protein assembly factor BamB